MASFSLASANAHAHGGNIECLAILANSSNPTLAFNRFMSDKYPKLSIVLKDPDQFFSTMRERFHAYRAIHINDPYMFDYSEIGIPLVADIATNLDRKILELQNNSNSSIKPREIIVATQYLRKLKEESQRILSRGSVGYIELMHFQYFYSRAIGHFDTHGFRAIDRWFLPLDRSLEGYQQLSIDQEYSLYIDQRFSVFQKTTTSEGFNAAASSFANAFSDPVELRQIWVPTNVALERDIFMRMMFKDIHFIGVTYDPILADGFLRPGGDFNMHDVRHESAKFFEKENYINTNHLNEYQIQQMNKEVDRWALELAYENSQIKNHDLKEAVNHLAFNFHHDRGYPLIPSVFLNRDKNLTAYLLYHAMIIGNQGMPFPFPAINLQRASKWLEKFWNERLSDEVKVVHQKVAPQS